MEANKVLSFNRDVMFIRYRINANISLVQFLDVLRTSGLYQTRPVHHLEAMQGMLDHGNLTASAWDGQRLVGLARAFTDFHYACCLADLAVNPHYQTYGIATTLQVLVQQQLGEHCQLILLDQAAQSMNFQKLGYEPIEHGWRLPRQKKINNPLQLRVVQKGA